ncbi:MAG: response regulator transcription factor [Prolixibacteraceae bacterium]
MGSGKLKILVADDHSVVRAGIINSLSAKFSDVEFGEASNSAEILNLVHTTEWNLVLLDIFMPGRNGLEVLKEIKSGYPDLPVIIFSMYPEDQFAVRAIKTGASAYLNKDISSKELARIVRLILNGERYLSDTVVNLITNELRGESDKDLHKLLSDREYQVFILIASGKSVSIIADELSLSVKTISVYRTNILKKICLKNSSEITHYAFKHNLIESSQL